MYLLATCCYSRVLIQQINIINSFLFFSDSHIEVLVFFITSLFVQNGVFDMSVLHKCIKRLIHIGVS